MNKGKLIEQKQLKQINLTEGLLKKILTLMFKPMMNRGMKKLIRKLTGDPELQSALSDHLSSMERTKDVLRHYCKKNPDSPLCDKKSATWRTYKHLMK